MNFLAHFHLDRRQAADGPAPASVEEVGWFTAGVMVLDLWPRFRRETGAPPVAPDLLRAAAPAGPGPGALRRGLVRHLEVDEAFHRSAAFRRWRAAARAPAERAAGRALAGLLAHVGVEVALDRWLLRREPDLARAFYERLDPVEPRGLEDALSALIGPAARGFGPAFARFRAARHLAGWASLEAAAASLAGTVALVGREPPARPALVALLEAIDLALARGPERPEAIEGWLEVRS